MSCLSEVKVLSNSKKEVVKKSLLPDKYLKQMVFAYWLNQKIIEKGTSLLETILFFETVDIQKVFYDTFDDNYKSIRSAMMEEIKIKNKSTTKSHDISDKNTTNPEAEYQTETKEFYERREQLNHLYKQF